MITQPSPIPVPSIFKVKVGCPDFNLTRQIKEDTKYISEIVYTEHNQDKTSITIFLQMNSDRNKLTVRSSASIDQIGLLGHGYTFKVQIFDQYDDIFADTTLDFPVSTSEDSQELFYFNYESASLTIYNM